MSEPSDGCSLRLERELWKKGVACVAGVDEAGRGPLAGPVIAGAVILPRDYSHEVLNDSKKLSHRQREKLYDELSADPTVVFASGRATVEEIEKINILAATHLAMRRAVENLPETPDHVLIDGLPVKKFPVEQTAVVKGDGISLSIAAASIVAKVERDRLMVELGGQYPAYGFESHKGYGTKRHIEALKSHGPCPIHRKTFQPVAQLTLDFDG